ncbi:hypothetical protein GGI21_003785 [Coemansia aciculifera]|nr:hypothetical protein GGI21_003785 [Coemansia aciculifera]
MTEQGTVVVYTTNLASVESLLKSDRNPLKNCHVALVDVSKKPFKQDKIGSEFVFNENAVFAMYVPNEDDEDDYLPGDVEGGLVDYNGQSDRQYTFYYAGTDEYPDFIEKYEAKLSGIVAVLGQPEMTE